MAPWIWCVLLFVLAVGLGFLELFVPSGGVLAVLTIFALVGSVVFAFTQHPVFGGVYLVLLIIGVPLLIRELLRLWPETLIGKKILLDPDQDPALQRDEILEQMKHLLGHSGIAKSLMMPGGLVEIEGHRYDAISEGIPIESGTPVIVIHVEGNMITVRAQTEKIPSAVRKSSQTTDGEIIEVENPFET